MKATTGMNVQRIVFNEITKRAVQESLKSPRAVNKELVDAYLARRALDYLVGFTLSPILNFSECKTPILVFNGLEV